MGTGTNDSGATPMDTKFDSGDPTSQKSAEDGKIERSDDESLHKAGPPAPPRFAHCCNLLWIIAKLATLSFKAILLKPFFFK